MTLTTIRTAPLAKEYVSLEEFQSRTPETFFGGKPVLYAHLEGATAWLPRAERSGLSAIFPSDSPNAPNQDDVMCQVMDVFVGSDFLTLFNHSNDSGIQIPYPSIALHAVKNVTIQLKEEIANKPTTAIYMQLLIAPDEDEYETATLTVIPASVSELGKATTSQLFSAISECSNLHPDPAPEGEENVSDDDRIVFESSQPIQGYSGVFVGASDGGLPPPMPGSGGWITAENVHDFFDADGNYIGNNSARDNSEPEELGSGAGRVRGRDEVDPGEDKTNGTHGDDLDNKRPRVE